MDQQTGKAVGGGAGAFKPVNASGPLRKVGQDGRMRR
jgi:hypothetical protein